MRLVCVVCKQISGKTERINPKIIPIEVAKAWEFKMQKGLCRECEGKIKQGWTAFFSDTRGCFLDKDKSDKLKLDSAYQGKEHRCTELLMDVFLGKITPDQHDAIFAYRKTNGLPYGPATEEEIKAHKTGELDALAANINATKETLDNVHKTDEKLQQ